MNNSLIRTGTGVRDMKTKWRPLKQSIYIGMFIYIVSLCVLFSFLTYSTLSRSLYGSYNRRMDDILQYVDHHIDKDDLAQCVKTNKESVKFFKMNSFMDSILEEFDVHYLYIIIPKVTDSEKYMVNVYSADTAYGRATNPDGYYLGMKLEHLYEDEDVLEYYRALNKDKISYIKDFTKWGNDYTAIKPLIDKDGNHFALLCVDVKVEEIEQFVLRYTLINVALIIMLGIIFTIVVTVWLRKKVVEPIGRLEKSVTTFAKITQKQPDPEFLQFDDPAIEANNEVGSLSEAVKQLVENLRIYARNCLRAEVKVEDMKTQVKQMDMLAYQDALTHVKNKTWYDKVSERVNDEIAKEKACFGIIMADLNNLKVVNDNYGHEKGNEYISGACHELCLVFSHSPIFRVGGDEFIVLLEGNDYLNREALFKKIREVYAKSCGDLDRKPWHRYSVALGMTVYDSSVDNEINDVFKRADELMYKDKLASKSARK